MSVDPAASISKQDSYTELSNIGKGIYSFGKTVASAVYGFFSDGVELPSPEYRTEYNDEVPDHPGIGQPSREYQPRPDDYIGLDPNIIKILRRNGILPKPDVDDKNNPDYIRNRGPYVPSSELMLNLFIQKGVLKVFKNEDGIITNIRHA